MAERPKITIKLDLAARTTEVDTHGKRLVTARWPDDDTWLGYDAIDSESRDPNDPSE